MLSGKYIYKSVFLYGYNKLCHIELELEIKIKT